MPPWRPPVFPSEGGVTASSLLVDCLLIPTKQATDLINDLRSQGVVINKRGSPLAGLITSKDDLYFSLARVSKKCNDPAVAARAELFRRNFILRIENAFPAVGHVQPGQPPSQQQQQQPQQQPLAGGPAGAAWPPVVPPLQLGPPLGPPLLPPLGPPLALPPYLLPGVSGLLPGVGMGVGQGHLVDPGHVAAHTAALATAIAAQASARGNAHAAAAAHAVALGNGWLDVGGALPLPGTHQEGEPMLMLEAGPSGLGAGPSGPETGLTLDLKALLGPVSALLDGMPAAPHAGDDAAAPPPQSKHAEAGSAAAPLALFEASRLPTTLQAVDAGAPVLAEGHDFDPVQAAADESFGHAAVGARVREASPAPVPATSAASALATSSAAAHETGEPAHAASPATAHAASPVQANAQASPHVPAHEPSPAPSHAASLAPHAIAESGQASAAGTGEAAAAPPAISAPSALVPPVPVAHATAPLPGTHAAPLQHDAALAVLPPAPAAAFGRLAGNSGGHSGQTSSAVLDLSSGLQQQGMGSSAAPQEEGSVSMPGLDLSRSRPESSAPLPPAGLDLSSDRVGYLRVGDLLGSTGLMGGGGGGGPQLQVQRAGEAHAAAGSDMALKLQHGWTQQPQHQQHPHPQQHQQQKRISLGTAAVLDLSSSSTAPHQSMEVHSGGTAAAAEAGQPPWRAPATAGGGGMRAMATDMLPLAAIPLATTAPAVGVHPAGPPAEPPMVTAVDMATGAAVAVAANGLVGRVEGQRQAVDVEMGVAQPQGNGEAGAAGSAAVVAELAAWAAEASKRAEHVTVSEAAAAAVAAVASRLHGHHAQPSEEAPDGRQLQQREGAGGKRGRRETEAERARDGSRSGREEEEHAGEGAAAAGAGGKKLRHDRSLGATDVAAVRGEGSIGLPSSTTAEGPQGRPRLRSQQKQHQGGDAGVGPSGSGLRSTAAGGPSPVGGLDTSQAAATLLLLAEGIAAAAAGGGGPAAAPVPRAGGSAAAAAPQQQRVGPPTPAPVGASQLSAPPQAAVGPSSAVAAAAELSAFCNSVRDLLQRQSLKVDGLHRALVAVLSLMRSDVSVGLAQAMRGLLHALGAEDMLQQPAGRGAEAQGVMAPLAASSAAAAPPSAAAVLQLMLMQIAKVEGMEAALIGFLSSLAAGATLPAEAPRTQAVDSQHADGGVNGTMKPIANGAANGGSVSDSLPSEVLAAAAAAAAAAAVALEGPEHAEGNRAAGLDGIVEGPPTTAAAAAPVAGPDAAATGAAAALMPGSEAAAPGMAAGGGSRQDAAAAAPMVVDSEAPDTEGQAMEVDAATAASALGGGAVAGGADGPGEQEAATKGARGVSMGDGHGAAAERAPLSHDLHIVQALPAGLTTDGSCSEGRA